MLADLLLLETYYEHPACAAFFEDLSRRYGPAAVMSALAAGDIRAHCIRCGPQKGRRLLWLSEQGRGKALGRFSL